MEEVVSSSSCTLQVRLTMVTMTKNVRLTILIALLLLLTFSSTKTTTTFSFAFQVTNSMSLQRFRRSAITTTTTTTSLSSISLSSSLSSLSYSSTTTVPTVFVGRLTTKRSINTRNSSSRSRLLLFRYSSSDVRTKTFSTRRRNMRMTSSSSSFFTEASSSNNDENNNNNNNNNNDSRNSIKEKEEEEEVYTIESLRNYAQQLIRKNSLQHNTNSYRYCFYFAGGGSLATSIVAATSGASSFLLEGRTTYNRFSYLNACTMSDSDTKGKSFSYGSREAAILLSNSALKQAIKLIALDDNLVGMPLTIGVGCTSVLATSGNTDTDKDSINDGGRGNVVVTRADGIRLTVTIQMIAGRERFDEDLMLSHLVLRSIELLMMYNDNDNDNEDENEEYNSNNNSNNKEYITRAGDIVTEEWELSTTTTLSTTDDDASTTIRMVGDNDIDSVIEDATRRVIDGGEDAVVLLPLYGSTPDNNNTTDKKKLLPSIIGIRALSHTVIPNNCLIFPGSFNPLHIGHLQLANASIRTLERLQPYIHPRKHNEKPILFELSLTNVDKPSIDPNIVISRIRKILELYASAAAISNNNDNENDNDTPKFPQQWGIVLTRAPLFEEKLNILRSKILVADDDQSSKKINFVIGTDTLVRILNPKYYPDQLRINMNKSLLELKSNGVGFIIGGRLEQQKQSTTSLQSSKSSQPSQPSQPQPRFVSGRDELTDLPEDIASMFTVMEESEFRVDLSSSEIRKEQQQQQEEEQGKIVK